MTKRIPFLFTFTFVLSFLFTANALFAQILITSSDLLSLMGKKITMKTEEEGSFTFNSGSPGANQVWDLRSLNFISPQVFEQLFSSPLGTAHATLFPNANLVHEVVAPDTIDAAFFSYYNITSNYYINLGDSMYYGGGLDTSLVSISNDTITSLPLQYGDTWQTVTADTQIIVPDFYYTVNTDTTLNTIDGWGTVRLPYGDFECLRLRIDEKSTNVAVSNGIAVTLSSESTIQYHWLTKGAFEVAWVQSQPGETDPNFTNAYGWGRLESMGPTTTVRNMTEVPDEISLLQNYPNPFNPATRIAFDLPESAPVKLEIFTILGQKVRSLVNTNMAPGQHIVSWDARDEMGRLVSGGFYIYRLEAGNTVKTRKMLYLK